jgi:thiol-disulfide isomerase/thioredoxin
MKKYVLIIVLVCSNLSFSQFQDLPFETAQKIALGTNKLIVLDFWATWCGPCKMMERETWNDETVINLLENYTPVKIDIDKNRELASKYDIKSIPYILILDGNGKIIYKINAYLSKYEVVKLLEKYSLSTEFLFTELVNYHKFPTAASSIRLSQKYLDYSLYLEEDLKNPFRNLAEDYLLEAKQKLKSENPENIESLQQRIELLCHFRDLYDKKYEKIEKRINKKINESKILKENLDIFYLINYIVFKGLKKTEISTSWEQKINFLENSAQIIKKANTILE